MRHFVTLLIMLSAINKAAAVQSGTAPLKELIWDSQPNLDKIQNLQNPDLTRIVWWNIGCGNTNSQLTKKDNQDSLYRNLETLAEDTAKPDVLILGEHCPTPMPKLTKKALNNNYPYSYILPKSNPYGKINNGIAVFSTWPIELMAKHNLEVGLNQKEIATTTRTYLLFKISSPEKDFFISPVHLYNPWKKLSITDFIFSAMGTDNPNYQQADLLLKNIQNDLDVNHQPLVVIGDFNSAKNFFLFNSMASYSLFSSTFNDGGASEATYPSLGAIELGNSYPGILIDHAFTTSSIPSPKTIMLQLRGSDHYPILLTF